MLHNARLADCCMSFSSLRARLVGGGGGDSTISIHIISAISPPFKNTPAEGGTLLIVSSFSSEHDKQNLEDQVFLP